MTSLLGGLQWKLRQGDSFFHCRHSLLMNQLEPLLAGLVLHVEIGSDASGERRRNHTVANCIAHVF